jgi:hypothetical protein
MMRATAWQSEWHDRLLVGRADIHVGGAKHTSYLLAHESAPLDALHDVVCCGHGGCVAVELHHRWVTQIKVDSHRRFHTRQARRAVWLLDGSPDVSVTHLPQANTYLLGFHDATWKYTSFLGEKSAADAGHGAHAFLEDPHVYLHIDDHVYRFDPQQVRSHMIDVRTRVTAREFADALIHCAPAGPVGDAGPGVERADAVDTHIQSSIDAPWVHDAPLPQCTLFLNQRGAGCGKTYESVQLVQAGTPPFAHKRQFIYLTKAHTAKVVIRDELVEQLEATRARAQAAGAVPPHASVKSWEESKKYRVEFTREQDDARISITIATIDSFIYALGDSSATAGGGGIFQSLCATIAAGHRGFNARGAFRYARHLHLLDKECLVVVDEAQDLPPYYLVALAALMRNTYIDVYVIGDKLQSLWDAHNVFTDGLPHTAVVSVKASMGVNVVRRFHKSEHMAFVNAVIDFAKYSLPPIEGVCGGVGCGYSHAPDDRAVVLLSQPSRASHSRLVAGFVDQVVQRVRDEVALHRRLPHEFMFIFPVLSNNLVAACLETTLNDFWIEQFCENAYRREVLAQHPHWGACMDYDHMHRHAFLHKSEVDRPINLEESRFSSRLLSIHASKGLGCNVVFLLGVTEAALKIYTQGVIDIVYDSLLHVAITRQKERLYIGVQGDVHDDIRARFTRNGAVDVECTVLDFPSASVQVSSVTQFIVTDKKWYDALNEAYFAPRDLEDAVPCHAHGPVTVPVTVSGPDPVSPPASGHDFDTVAVLARGAGPGPGIGDTIIEWGDHVIRTHVMQCTLLHLISHKDTGVINTSQVVPMLYEIQHARVRVLMRAPYYKALCTLNDDAKQNRDARPPPFIPVLEFHRTKDGRDTEYTRYRVILVRMIHHIQAKIRTCGGKVPTLCPIEMCVVVHIQQVMRHGQYTKFSIHEMYRILQSVSLAPDVRHHGFGCMCNDILCGDRCVQTCEGSDSPGMRHHKVSQSIARHHLVTAHMRRQFDAFMHHLRSALGDDSPVSFNINHMLVFDGCSINHCFKLYDTLPFIATTTRHVVLLAMCPSFTRMERDGVFVKALLQTFMVRNVSKSSANFKRFHGKQVFMCVFTFSSDAPVWLNLHYSDGDDGSVRECIAGALVHRFAGTNETLWAQFRKRLQQNNLRAGPTFQAMEEMLDGSKSNVPEYVTRFMCHAKKESRKKGCFAVRSVEDIHAALKDSVTEFLYVEDSEW